MQSGHMFWQIFKWCSVDGHSWLLFTMYSEASVYFWAAGVVTCMSPVPFPAGVPVQSWHCPP